MILSRLILCNTHRRFKRIFNKLEKEGVALSLIADWENPAFQRRARSYVKNVTRVNELYAKFNGE